MRRHSPYNYAFDNPIYFIDADGMAPEGNSDGYGTISETSNSYQSEGYYNIEDLDGNVKGTISHSDAHGVLADSGINYIAGGGGGGKKSNEEPPVNGLNWFYDDSGDYFWNEELGTYEHYSAENGSFLGYYSADKFSLPDGAHGIIFDSASSPKEKFNDKHSIKELATPLMSYLKTFGEIEELTNQDKYPGVKIFSSEHMNGAVTLGNMIFVSSNMEDSYTLAHEYGHFLDFKYHFKYNQGEYIKTIGIPSIISAGRATFGDSNHHDSRSEIRADILGGDYHNLKLCKPKK